MFRAGMSVMQQPREDGTKVVAAADRRFKKRLLQIARDISPHVDRSSAKPERKLVFFLGHVILLLR
jgi:hypothetical protein